MTHRFLLALITVVAILIPHAGNAGGLLDQDGRAITEADFAPKYRLLYFGYTMCPDACPLGLQTMSDTLDRLGPLGESVTPVFVSIDPSRDTPDVLKKYIAMFHPRLRAITGNDEAIAEVAARYRVIYRKVDLGPDRPYTVDHSTSIYLVDSSSKVVGRYLHTLPAADMAKRILKVLARE